MFITATPKVWEDTHQIDNGLSLPEAHNARSPHCPHCDWQLGTETDNRQVGRRHSVPCTGSPLKIQIRACFPSPCPVAPQPELDPIPGAERAAPPGARL